MSGQPIVWLPRSALLDVRSAAPVARALGEWSEAWLAHGKLAAAPRWEPCHARPDAGGFAEIGTARGFRLLLRAEGRLDLASLLLGREIGERECRTAQDRAVIERLTEAALDSLTILLGDVLAGPAAPSGEERFALTVDAGDGVPLLRLETGREALVALALAWAGPPRPAPRPAAPRSAFAPQQVRLAARIGASRLALSEIESLEVGDVLTLDTPLSVSFAACIDGVPAASSALSLIADGENVQLQLTRPAAQW